MRGTANMVAWVAANNCDQALLANDGIADRHDPARFFAAASWRAFFPSDASFNKSVRAVAIVNLRLLRKYSSLSFFFGNERAKFPKIFLKSENFGCQIAESKNATGGGSGGNCYRSKAAGRRALLYLGIIREGGSSVEGLIRAR